MTEKETKKRLGEAIILFTFLNLGLGVIEASAKVKQDAEFVKQQNEKMKTETEMNKNIQETIRLNKGFNKADKMFAEYYKEDASKPMPTDYYAVKKQVRKWFYKPAEFNQYDPKMVQWGVKDKPSTFRL